MRAQYEIGRGLMIFIPPTESDFATDVLAFIIECMEDKGNDPQEFYQLLASVIDDRRVIQ